MKETFYTVGEVSEMTHVTIKTLHFYQKIGILLPHHIGKNNYRYYSSSEINRLQEILLYRNMGFQLEDIKKIYASPTPLSRLDILRSQREYAQKQHAKYESILDLINHSIDSETKGLNLMKHEEKFNNLKTYEDSLPRTLTNLTVIFAKPQLISLCIFGIAMIIYNVYLLITGTHTWGTETQSTVISIIFIIIGTFVVVSTSHTIFFKKLKTMLENVNEPYKKK